MLLCKLSSHPLIVAQWFILTAWELCWNKTILRLWCGPYMIFLLLWKDEFKETTKYEVARQYTNFNSGSKVNPTDSGSIVRLVSLHNEHENSICELWAEPASYYIIILNFFFLFFFFFFRVVWEYIMHLPWMISNSLAGSLDIIHGSCSIFSYNPK